MTTQSIDPDIDGRLNAIRRTLQLWENIVFNPKTDAGTRKRLVEGIERVYKALVDQPQEEPAVKARVTSP